MIRFIIFFAVLFLIDLYTFQAIKTLVKQRFWLVLYACITVAIIIFIVYRMNQFDRRIGQTQQTLFTMGVFVLFYVPKLFLILPLIFEDVFRAFSAIVNLFTKSSESFIPERRKFVSQIALGIAAVPFLSIIYGITKGRYNFKVIKQTLYFDDLPENFDGFTLTHISDIHSGSFDNPEEIAYAIDLINQQPSDLLLFTGDIVNSLATEMHPWIPAFKNIRTHTFGKFSILGNHDYGEYLVWDKQQAKIDNFEAIKNLHPQIDFKLLTNEYVTLTKNNQHIQLIGVENWGKNFKQAGDLTKASEGVAKDDFKILMSHDPSHWELQVKNHPKNYQLTLSGHTHGMQFGIEIPGVFQWSPVQFMYKQWAGLYQEMGRYIYVNRGFGYHAYPGRVGIMPEITILTLKKGKNL
jgi:hypothetical protein